MISYFEVHRNKASGLSMTLAAIGPIIFPPIITMLLKFYGSEGCIWLLGAFSLNIFAAALLLQPVEWHMKRVKSIDTEMQLLNTKIVSHSNDAINDGSPHTSNSYLYKYNRKTLNYTNFSIPSSFGTSRKRRNPTFIKRITKTFASA